MEWNLDVAGMVPLFGGKKDARRPDSPSGGWWEILELLRTIYSLLIFLLNHPSRPILSRLDEILLWVI